MRTKSLQRSTVGTKPDTLPDGATIGVDAGIPEVWTTALARAAATDAANAQMRRAGRTKWSRSDFNEAVRVLFTLLGEPITATTPFAIAAAKKEG
jgi:hypothetical protein